MTELYYITNGNDKRRIATKEYLDTNKIPYNLTEKEKIALRYEHLPYAHRVHSHQNNNKPLGILDVNGIKLIYLFGEKTWFDTQEELDEYRKEYHKENNILIERNKIKKAIISKLDEMEKEELEKLLAKLS